MRPLASQLSLMMALGLFLLAFAPSAVLAKDQLVVKQSKYSVAETLDRLTKLLKSKGITIFARIDHETGAKKAGMELRPTQLLIFGNPKMGTALMQANQQIGLSLPMKALAYKDKAGRVWLAYRQPADLQKAYGLMKQGRIFDKMKSALGMLTDKAVR